ncbi:MAG: hypothetical protein R3B96_12895 [Pirellulaceae bacterium]
MLLFRDPILAHLAQSTPSPRSSLCWPDERLFEDQTEVEVIPQVIAQDERLNGTQIGQLVIENSWIGVSIVDTETTPIAEHQTGLLERLRALALIAVGLGPTR